MTQLTRIQMVVYLQAVELFTYCTAEQMVRIASIARQRNVPSGEEIYSANDPAESNDLAAKQPKVFREMVARLQRHVQRGGQIPWQKRE